MIPPEEALRRLIESADEYERQASALGLFKEDSPDGQITRGIQQYRQSLEPASPRQGEPVDVERLARAMRTARASLQGYVPATYERQAEAILAALSDPTEAGERRDG